MLCEAIQAENFRNIVSADVTFSPGVNVIYGENAQGKTNLLEAVAYLALGKSFRGVRDADLIRFGEENAHLKLTYRDSVRKMEAEAYLTEGKHKRIVHNGMTVGKLSDMMGQFRVVLFSPEHLSLIKSGPELRRGFLDMALSQLRPLYLSTLQKYAKILKERNSLLHHAGESEAGRRAFEATVDVWSDQLAHEAAILSRYRMEYIVKMRAMSAAVFREMCNGRETPGYRYVTSLKLPEEAYADIAETEKRYRELLYTAHAREIGAGYTLWGAHKDDIEIELNGKSARLFASQGQQRSLALSMKLAEGEICRSEWGDDPVYLFDDVQSELDAGRRSYLTSRIRNKQVILTTCEPSADSVGEDGKRITVQNGIYQSNSR